MTQSHRQKPACTPLLAAAIALSLAAPFAAAADRKPRTEFDQFIVRFKDAAPEHGNAAARQHLLQELGRAQGLRISELRRAGGGEDVIRTDRRLKPDQVKRLIGRLRANPHVLYAEVDLPVYPALSPNDPLYASNQWHYFESTAGINAPAAWDITTGAGEKIAVLDTGITSHSDLNANVVGGYDFITDITTANDTNGRDASPADPGDWTVADECGPGSTATNSSWHGTHVAGTIGAVTNNGVGVAGIAHSGKVVPIRVLGKCGGTSSDINDAIRWAAGLAIAGVPANANPAKVINLSLGGPGACLASTQSAIDAAVAAGATVVIAAGNDNDESSGYQPGNCNNIITVGAMDRTGGRASYSNYGTRIDITAPGGGGGQPVASTLNAGTTVPAAENYAGYQGTSMATPHVAGVVALVNDVASPSLTPAAMESLLKVTSRTQPVPCTLGCGVGMLDAHAAVIAGTTAVLNITDPVDVVEANSGTHTQTFTVNLSRAVGSTVGFNAFTSNGTAQAGSDYVALGSAAYTIPAGQLSKSFTVTVNGDTSAEDDETFFLEINNVTGPVTVIDTVGTAQIVNDDVAALTPNVPVTGLADAVTGHDLRYQMAVPAGATDLQFAISGGTGDADLYVKFGSPPTEGDFDCAPFLGGNNETCPMATQAGTWHVMVDAFTPYSGLTLEGSYTLPVSVSINDASVAEGNSGTKLLTFTVRLSATSATPVTYNIATANGSASSATDYVARSLVGETIPAGQLTRAFAVTLNGDTNVENNETFFINLAGVSGAVVGDGQGKGTLLNDDGPTLSIADVRLAEGNSGTKVMTFVARLSQAAAVPVTFNIATSNGTASSATDYVASTLTGQTIPAGQLTRTFPVTIKGDTTAEANETFAVTLSAVTGASVFDDRAVGTILNDEGATLSINDVQVAEGNAGTKLLTFTVKLSQAAPGNVTFTAATANGSASSATDYVAKTASAQVITAGTLTKTFAVTLNGDTNAEKNETFFVNLTGVTGATVFDSAGTGTILNDEGPTLSIGDVAITEGNSGTKSLVFTVSLSQVAAGPVTYSISTSNGTAAAGSDYVASSLTGQTIAAGLLSKTFTVTINGDTAVEPNQTFAVNLTASTGATIMDNRAIGTITNDD